MSDWLVILQSGTYDSFTFDGELPDWCEVVAVSAVRTAGAEDGVDVATMDEDRIDRLRTVFWDMCLIETEEETNDHPDSDPDDGIDDSWTGSILHITITAKTADDMRTKYGFSASQNTMLDELLTEGEALEALRRDLSGSTADVRAVLVNLPEDLSPERRTLIETACQLVGKVSYWWGGKSTVCVFAI